MTRILRLLDGYIVPILVGIAYLGLISTSDMTPAMMIVTLGFGGLVLMLWSAFKELRTHAIASRHAAVGDADELLALADEQLARRIRPSGKAPFQVYRAVAFELRGDTEAAKTAIAAVDLTRIAPRSRRAWSALLTATKINVLAHDGAAAEARAALDDELRPALKGVVGPGADIILREAEARVLLAEGRTDEARPIFDELAKDIRLGSATRAACGYYAGKCVEATDPDAARTAYAAAAKLAPNTWMGKPAN